MARAMALPVIGGMIVEPLTSFIVPTLYAGYMEIKIALGRGDTVLNNFGDVVPDSR